MSLTPAATRAIEWLEQQIRDLASVRNATARDPVFRNWRQGTVTVLQRIWPGDQPRLERFRRIPFSPADTRADSRAIREAYSRGCQEAQRVLKDFIEDVRKHGVAAAAHDSAHESPDDFAAGIPTLQLGGAGPSNVPTPAPPSAPEPAPPAGADAVPASPKPAARANGARTSPGANGRSASRAGSRSNGQPKPVAAPAEPAASVEPATPATPAVPSSDVHGDMGDLPPQGYGESCPLPVKKNRRAKPLLRDLLDRAQESARAIVGPPREENPPEASPEPIVDRPSVVTSHRTTLRGTIDKVSLDSLISPEFRETTPESAVPSEPLDTFATDETLPPLEASATDEEPVAPVPAPVADVVAEPEPIAPASPPPLAIVPAPAPSAPLEDPEFAVHTPSAATSVPPAAATPAAVLRLVAPLPIAPEVASASAEDAADAGAQDGLPDAEVEAFAEAAEAFLHTSPVLGASAVPRPVATPHVREERLFVHPDAIAIASIVDDLHTLGIPESRHPETRARLMDLAQRLETADLEWHLLRAAVWFAMEYPRLACRVVPVLLPRMDRAA